MRETFSWLIRDEDGQGRSNGYERASARAVGGRPRQRVDTPEAGNLDQITAVCLEERHRFAGPCDPGAEHHGARAGFFRK